MLDFRVQSFLAVCKHMSYTKAAKELKLTQPAISQQIKYLEDYYGAPLFDYQNRRLSLTPQGELLKNAMETLHHDSLRIIEEIHKVEKRHTLHLGATLTIGEYFLPEHLSAFLKKYPDMDISVTVADTQDLLRRLDSGEIDLVLCEGNFDKRHYAWKLISTERLACYCGSGYDTSAISNLESLFDHRILLREDGSGTREIFENYLKQHGYSLDCFSKRSDFTTPRLIVKLLLDNQGISFLYSMVGREYLKYGSLKEVPLEGFSLEHELNAIWMKDSLYSENYSHWVDEIISQ